MRHRRRDRRGFNSATAVTPWGCVGGFVRNAARMLELMLPPYCQQVTDACPARDHVLPLYLDGDHFTTPFCCYGNDVDCTRCGAWVVFHLASRLSGEATASDLGG